MTLRCFPGWRIQQIRLTIPSLPLTADTKLAEDVIEMIGSFPDCSKSMDLAKEAVEVLQKHVNELQSSADRIDQDHARRLERYIETLNQKAYERLLEYLAAVEKDLAAVRTELSSAMKYDQRIIAQFMMDTNFGEKLFDTYLSGPGSDEVNSAMLCKCEMLLSQVIHTYRDTGDIKELVETRMQDEDFRNFLARTREFH